MRRIVFYVTIFFRGKSGEDCVQMGCQKPKTQPLWVYYDGLYASLATHEGLAFAFFCCCSFLAFLLSVTTTCCSGMNIFILIVCRLCEQSSHPRRLKGSERTLPLRIPTRNEPAASCGVLVNNAKTISFAPPYTINSSLLVMSDSL